jgi:hypothetical protein
MLGALGAEAQQSAWATFWNRTKSTVGNLASSALDMYAQSAAKELGKSLNLSASTKEAQAKEQVEVQARLVEPADTGSTLKTAALIGIPVAGLLAAIAVWRMSR